jgi:hypothetical protein
MALGTSGSPMRATATHDDGDRLGIEWLWGVTPRAPHVSRRQRLTRALAIAVTHPGSEGLAVDQDVASCVVGVWQPVAAPLTNFERTAPW